MPLAAELVRQDRRQLGLPVADDLMAEDDTADQDHLREVAQTELVAQAPEYRESDDIGGVLGPVQWTRAALVEWLGAFTAAEPAIALARLCTFSEAASLRR